MDIAETGLLTLATILMIGGVIAAFIPILPGALIVWGIAIVYGLLDNFQHVTPAAAIVMTALMIIGSANDLWLPVIGIRTGGLSCLSAVGGFAGGLIGTFVIPIPFGGTLIGCVLGALIAEYLRIRQLRDAIRAGKTQATLFIVSYVVELAASLLIFGVYLVSITTR